MKLYDKRDDLNFPIVNILFICNIQQHLNMKYISLSWYDIPEFVVHIIISKSKRWVGFLIVLNHWNNSPRVDMSLHSDILFWFRAKQTTITHSLPNKEATEPMVPGG
jgi:hypothetical protein